MPLRLTNYLLALLLTLTSPVYAATPVPASCQTTSPANWFTSRLVPARAGDGDEARLTTLVDGNDGYLQAGTEALPPTEPFTRDGRQLRTIDAVTGQTLAQFSYDANGYLLHLTDLDGDVTTIERDAKSVPKAIIAPDGQRTTLTVNSLAVTSTGGGSYQRLRFPKPARFRKLRT